MENEHPVSWPISPPEGRTSFRSLTTAIDWRSALLTKWGTGTAWELRDMEFPDLWLVLSIDSFWSVRIKGAGNLSLRPGRGLLIPAFTRFDAVYAGARKRSGSVWAFHLSPCASGWVPAGFSCERDPWMEGLLESAWGDPSMAAHSARMVLLRAVMSGHLAPPPEPPPMPMLGIRALEIIESNWARKDFSVESLAAGVGCSATHLRRVFAASGQESPRRHLIRRRLEAACRLLREDPLARIGEIAEFCGFSTPNYFHAVFRAQFGQSPMTWRNLQTGFASGG